VLPALIHDSLTTPFNFYRDEHIHQGVVCQNRMYALVKAFSRNQRGHAMALALKLSHQAVQPLITVSSCSTYYRVWVDLQSHDAEFVKNLISGDYSKDFHDDGVEPLSGQDEAIAFV
jgi:hypothetical protein